VHYGQARGGIRDKRPRNFTPPPGNCCVPNLYRSPQQIDGRGGW
jgi:hypothetical protein